MDEANNMLSAMRQSFRGSDAASADTSAVEFPLLATMIDAVLAVFEDGAPLNDGLAAVQRERQRMTLMLSAVELSRQSAGDDEALDQLFDRIGQQHHEYDDELTAIEVAVNKGERGKVDAATARLYKISSALYSCNAAFQAGLRDAQSTAMTEGGGGAMIPHRYADLFDLSMALAQNAVSVDKWQSQLDTCKESLTTLRNQHADGLLAMGTEQMKDAHGMDVGTDIARAIDDGLVALGRMELYPHTKKVQDLKDGWNALFDALVRLQKALSAMTVTEVQGDVVLLGDDE